MVNGADKALVKRVEHLESEVEEQRTLLRYALGRQGLDVEERAPVQEAPKPADVKPFEKGERRGSQGAGRATNDWDTTVQSPREVAATDVSPDADKTVAKGEAAATDKAAAMQDGDNLSGALAEMFRLRGWEWWLNKIGIGLLLFGIVFLFKFSVDQGWLVPVVRIGMGLFFGAALIFFGLRTYADRREFSQVLLGGGIATFYITGFAAFQLYGLVSHPVAFGFMVLVTLLAFTISIKQEDPTLAVIGAMGGFGTPFLLYDGSGTLGGLVFYTALILAGTISVYLYKGWRTLLVTSVVGAWAALMAGHAPAALTATGAELWSLQACIVFTVLSLWLVPAAREVLRSRHPDKWTSPDPGRLARSLFPDEERLFRSSVPAHALSGTMPLVGFLFTQEVWNLPKESLGLVALGTAFAYAAVSFALSRLQNGGLLYYTNALAALLMFTLGITLFLEGNTLYLALTLEAAALHYVARRLSDKPVTAVANAIFLSLAVWLAGRLFFGAIDSLYYSGSGTAFLNTSAILDLFLVAVAFGISTLVAPQSVARAYRIFAHAAVLGLVFRETMLMPGGGNIVFLFWAAYAAGLYALSLRLPEWGTIVGSHILWGLLGLWLTARLAWDAFASTEEIPVFNLSAIVDLAAISLALLTSYMLTSPKTILVYRVAVHIAVLAWFAREFAFMPNGDAYVTIAWGLYAAGLLVFGLRRSSAALVRTGGITLLLVVGKLFLVDLMWVGAVWRILLFIGFGGALLILSYYLQALWKTTKTGDTSKTT